LTTNKKRKKGPSFKGLGGAGAAARKTRVFPFSKTSVWFGFGSEKSNDFKGRCAEIVETGHLEVSWASEAASCESGL
jgi:hypothetical protein